eukprot:Skav218674  [mRNA]  locus=scaffold44:185663:188572:- [translate_table: standard]
MKSLVRLLQRVWLKHVCRKLRTRKDFRLDTFDQKGNDMAFKQLKFLEQVHAMNYVTGRNITHDILSKFLPGVQSGCVLCGKPDSREHKAFFCTAALKVCKDPQALKRIQRHWPKECWTYGLCPKVNIPQGIKDVWNLQVPFSVPEQNDTIRFFFTDGTAFCAEDPDLCLSAAAIVESKWMQHRCIYSERLVVPGPQQNSFMGELFAILLVFNTAWKVRIYTDNQAVLDMINNALTEHAAGRTMRRDAAHIWDYILEHIAVRPAGFIQLEKVKAHTDPGKADSPLLKWLVWGNNRADKEAKLAVTHDKKTLLAASTKELDQVKKNRCDLQSFLQYIADVAKLCVESQQSALRIKRESHKLDLTMYCFEGAVQTVGLCIPMPLSCFWAFPYGGVYLWRLLWWARQLQWPKRGQRTRGDISYLELLVDFQLATHSAPPRSITDRVQRDKCGAYHYILDDHEIQADAKPRTLADLSDVWKRSVNWLLHNYKGDFFLGDRMERVESLVALGCSSWLGGFNVRPRLSQGNHAAELLHTFFVTGRGCNRALGRVLAIPSGKTPTHPTEALAADPLYLPGPAVPSVLPWDPARFVAELQPRHQEELWDREDVVHGRVALPLGAVPRPHGPWEASCGRVVVVVVV